jgi:hypothetical protein
MLSVNLQGGIGNQLFQLAAAETIAAQTKRTFCIPTPITPRTHHSSQNYFDNVFQSWRIHCQDAGPATVVVEPSYDVQPWETQLDSAIPHVALSGYFQNYRYIPSNFCDRLELPIQSFDPKGVFLHIRGGDYVAHPLHDVQLERTYYPWAIQQFPPDTHFYVFTNDIAYAKTMPFLHSISHSFLITDELQALNCMRQCVGGICANSTFSWWGGYLAPQRKIVIPSKWFNDTRLVTRGYSVPGWIIGPT